ncbi:hypothetical protein KR51_00008310 [Rubidibacter lacunae KORDI 51-2]|uniref:Phosphate ABC transporter permease n=1 Tax=Rubidibacter lacunae KORDI 51-2 TaxID=582515 RepID=U5DDC3_9CHRO|nr:hypothetical protein [Rubidibacter lacunae]ERN42513.1 hypothetical protein KR51_00008310 [Rubidibacter lacunae KORDI 51-2]
MLVPLTRAKFEELVPLTATAVQYRHYWGDWTDLLRRLLIAFVTVLILLIVGKVMFEPGGDGALSIFIFVAGLYWLWAPVAQATWRNSEFRRIPYCGFWRGRVMDAFVTEELIGVEETVDEQGNLVIVENRERCINLEVGDESGFSTQLQAPLRREHKLIRRGQDAEMLLLSSRSDLSRIVKHTDVYLPEIPLWVGDYPQLQHLSFEQVSADLAEEFPPRDTRRAARRRRSARNSYAR